MAPLAAASLYRATELTSAPLPHDIAPEDLPATPESQPLSTVKDEILGEYRQRYSVLGDLSDIELDLPDDPEEQAVAVPRQLVKGALAAVDWYQVSGALERTHADFKTFTDVYLARSATKSELALSLYNPYTYLPSWRYHEDADALQEQLHDPNELFANVVTTWATYPDGLIDRWDQLPDETNTSDMAIAHAGDATRPSWEKQLVQMTTEHALALAYGLVRKEPGEGQGIVATRLAQIAPRLGMIKVSMDL